jgi:hypothetical protein
MVIHKCVAAAQLVWMKFDKHNRVVEVLSSGGTDVLAARLACSDSPLSFGRNLYNQTRGIPNFSSVARSRSTGNPITLL